MSFVSERKMSTYESLFLLNASLLGHIDTLGAVFFATRGLCSLLLVLMHEVRQIDVTIILEVLLIDLKSLKISKNSTFK